MAKKHSEPYRLFKRGQIWHLYLTYGGTQLRCSTGTTSHAEAEEYALQKIADLKRQAELRRGGLTSATLDETFGRYFTEKAKFQTRPSQTLTRLNNLKQWLNITYLNELNEPIISQMVAQLRQKIKNATINRYLALLSVVMNTAIDEWHYEVKHIKISKFKLPEPAENVKYIKDAATAQKIIDRAPAWMKPLIKIALHTGLRLGNLLSLKWQYIDFTSGAIDLKVKSRTKEGGKNHHIPLTDEALEILRSLPRTSEFVFVNSKGKPMKYIQTTWNDIFYKWQLVKNTQELTDKDVLYCKKYTTKDGKQKVIVYKRVLKDPELPYINFHTIRHTTGTWLAHADVNAKTIKEIMGHEDIRTTNKYMHASDAASRSALNSVFHK